MLWIAPIASATPPAPSPAPAPALGAAIAPLGFDALDGIEEIRFTFNVERDGASKGSRSWTWRPAEGTVTRRAAPPDAALTFPLGAPRTDEERKADAQFINDSFWLAPQLHLRWGGDDLQLVDGGERPLPIGEGRARMITMRYAPEGGGYTPGDAYDLFVDATGRIVAWHYRAKNADAPSLTTTFEDYVAVGPLQIASEHYDADRAFRLFFTDLSAR